MRIPKVWNNWVFEQPKICSGVAQIKAELPTEVTLMSIQYNDCKQDEERQEEIKRNKNMKIIHSLEFYDV